MPYQPLRRSAAAFAVACATAVLAVCVALPADAAPAPAAPHAMHYKGPAGNRVAEYCQRHLSDDTPRAARLPDRALDCQLQWTGARFGYVGPVDGELGRASWRGVQSYLRSVGAFRGSVTGRLDDETKRAIQRKAATAPHHYRYRGRIGAPLRHSAWRGLAYFTDLPWAE